MSADRRRFLLITNPIAGRVGHRLLQPVLACLAAAGATVRSCPSVGIEASARAVADVVQSGDVDAVIAAGGDGTFRLAATALLGSNVPLGLIPLGTGNVLAHELALPRDARQIADILLHGETRPLQAALANGAPFFLMAGAGFDGAVIERLDHDWKHRIGKLAYVPPTLRALRAPLPRLEVTIDGAHHEASWLVVANARCYGGGFVLVPHTHAFDHGLHAVLFHSRDRLSLVRQLIGLAQGRLLARPDVRMLGCRHVSVRSAVPVSVQIDGDAAGTTPLGIMASSDSVHVILPRFVAPVTPPAAATEKLPSAAGS